MLTGNLWPNPTFESVSSTAGVPSSWHLGGSNPGFDLWGTDESVSPGHSLKLEDASETEYGEWYSDRIPAVSGAEYSLRYHLKYETLGTMRLTVNFADAAGASLTGQSFAFVDSLWDWTAFDQTFTAPEGAVALWLTFASGGSEYTTGTAWLDDVSLVNNSGPSQGTNTTQARALEAPLASNLVVDGDASDWANLGADALTMDTQGRGSVGTMAVDIQYAWDPTRLFLLIREDPSRYTASVQQEAADAAAYQSGPWSVDSIGFWLDLDNNAGTLVDGVLVSENNADFQPWFGFSSSGRKDLSYARVNDSGSMNLDGLANAEVATGGSFAQHNRVIEVALRWADLAATVDPSRQPGGDLLAAVVDGYTFGSEPLLVYHDYNSQAFLGPDQWNPPTGVDTNSIDVRLTAGGAQASPRLSVQSQGGQWRIAWPSPADGFILESSPQVGAGATWTVVSEAPALDTSTSTYGVSFSPNGSAAFYRLRKAP